MNCVNHPDREAADPCALCGQPLCEECAVSLPGGSYCRDCLQEAVAQETASPSDAGAAAGPVAASALDGGDQAPPRRVSPKSPFLAFVLSLVPGVGHMYLELMRRGLSFTVIFFGAVTLSVVLQTGELMAFLGPVIYFYSIFDAMQHRRRINAGEPVADRPVATWRQVESWLRLRPGQTQTLVAYLLILFGALKLLQNLTPWYRIFPYNPISSLSPLLIVGIGLWLLLAGRERTSDGAPPPGKESSAS
ncbi:MAG: hypothetical protein ACM3ZA_05505 [Bacillota bacterium]